MKKTVLVIHQSAELYGSDRSLLELLMGWRGTDFSFVVAVPEEGPLVPQLRALGLRVEILPLVKIGRKTFTPLGLLKLPYEIISAIFGLNKITRDLRVDIVYTNTLAVLAGAFWALFHRKPHVWHVREIINTPRVVSLGFRLMVHWLSCLAVCNSKKTAEWVGVGKRSRAVVVWNGVSRTGNSRGRLSKHELGFAETLPLILLVGRINGWKGQDLLVKALALLKGDLADQCQLAIVGGAPPGQEHFMRQLEALVRKSTLADRIKIVSFTEQVDDYYQVADILVVPSREPEPFGRVAIEGMSYGLPVLAAAHGGLVEIVEDGVTGMLFEPNSEDDLGQKLTMLLESSSLRQEMGRNAKLRQESVFSLEAYQSAVFKLLSEVAQ